jgi:hypothetical protein
MARGWGEIPPGDDGVERSSTRNRPDAATRDAGARQRQDKKHNKAHRNENDEPRNGGVLFLLAEFQIPWSTIRRSITDDWKISCVNPDQCAVFPHHA